MGEHDRLDVVEPRRDVLEIRQDQVDAGVMVLGEEHSAVDDEKAAVVFDNVHVPADLAEAAERNHAHGPVG